MAEMFAGATSGGPYRCCTEPAASRSRSRKSTGSIDQMVLGQAALKGAGSVFFDICVAEWHGYRAFVLKAALVVREDMVPIEIARCERSDEVALVVRDNFARLAAAGYPLPHLSTNLSTWFVNATLVASLNAPMEWTGRVSAHWTPPVRGEWVQPISADVLTVAEAVGHDPRLAEGAADGFAWMRTANDKLLMAYGPSARGNFYVHRSKLSPDSGEESIEQVERKVRGLAGCLDRAGSPLEEFRAERFCVSFEKPNSYRHVTRRILLAYQLPLWQVPPFGRRSGTDELDDGAGEAWS